MLKDHWFMKDIYEVCYVGEEANRKTAIDGLNNGDPAMEQYFDFDLYKGEKDNSNDFLIGPSSSDTNEDDEYEGEGSYYEHWDEGKGVVKGVYNNELGGGYDGGGSIRSFFLLSAFLSRGSCCSSSFSEVVMLFKYY